MKIKPVKRLRRFYKKKKDQFNLFRYRVLAKLQSKTIVHFLHIGKTGGTAIKYALKKDNKPYINKKYIVFCHPHTFHLTDSFKGEKVFFFVRDPVDRFVSGFYSRKRKGMPRAYHEWTPGETKAFEVFNTPNELANSLATNGNLNREKAVEAMESIDHVRYSYWYWFKNEPYFLSRIRDVIFVGNQKRLDEDFIKAKKILDISENIELPKDDVQAHKNPEGVDKSLSKEAIAILEKWYAEDYRFLDLLHEKGLLKNQPQG